MEDVKQYSYDRAKRRVEDLKSFYYSLVGFCLVIPFLWWLNSRTTDFLWAIFPTVGWGIGLVSLWMTSHGYNPIFGKEWEERKIKEFMDNKEF
ncbi:2TM domain-containing protein [Flagellimonas baculiformis]|uniref:2TM domain-containing protein n=1 Tax=Flagellimonas baculiformis TaxID=3067310 RepID=UPI00296E2E2A|nr:2TM domain-containing protein [Muricauda sp. D6]